MACPTAGLPRSRGSVAEAAHALCDTGLRPSSVSGCLVFYEAFLGDTSWDFMKSGWRPEDPSYLTTKQRGGRMARRESSNELQFEM